VRIRTTLTAGLLAATTTLALGACGGGGGDDKAGPSASATAATVAAKAKSHDAAYAWATIHAAVPTSRFTLTVTEANDGNHLIGRPHQYTSAIKFSDSRIKPSDVEGSDPDDVDRGGGIEVFASRDDAQARAAYIQAIAKAAPMFAEYDYVHGNTVIRVSHYLTPAQAAEYDKAAAGL
jgi:hypothetical protein